MRKMWTKSSKRRSMSAASRLANSDDTHSLAESVELEAFSSHVRSMVDPEYDTTSVKHAWLNAVLNALPQQDFNESSLRLYRVELRGSHLYVYRPPLLMNVHLFRVDSKPSSSGNGAASEPDTATLAPLDHGAPSKSESHSVADSIAVTTPSTLASTNDFEPHGDGSPVRSRPKAALLLSSLIIDGQAVAVPNEITYFLQAIPHPDLKFEPSSGSFTTTSSIEALVHFFIFADGQTHQKSIRQLTISLPLLSKFGEILKLMQTFLQAIFSGSFVDYKPNADVFDRIVGLLEHVDQHLSGFLLKSDVAPNILKLLQLVSGVSPANLLATITQLQESIVAKQQTLLGLIGNVDNSISPTPSRESIFEELNSQNFMHNFGLLDLVTAITEIDLLFFKSWNSSMDKSLLLYTSMWESNPGDYFYKKNSLLFDNITHLHYLARLLIHHLFIENLPSTSERRARILEKWIDLGCLLDKCGNMSSWLGISSVVLSQPVLRLNSVWAHVGEDYIKLLKNDWSPVLFELDQRRLSSTSGALLYDASSMKSFLNSRESYHIMAPRGLGKIFPKERVVPYFGDLLVNNTKIANIAELEAVWKKIIFSFERWNDYLSNLSNYPDIISYNQDVLRRYDSMGFMFSNESLNQVLYLGVNKEDGNSNTLVPKLSTPELLSSSRRPTSETQDETREKLFRLLEINCESINLTTVMEYSLRLEPTLKEAYLSLPEKNVYSASSKSGLRELLSPVSVESFSSLISHSTNDLSDDLTKSQTVSNLDATLEDKLPTFNLHYYKIDIPAYDNLAPRQGDKFQDMPQSRDIFVDNDLVLRLDDFTSDFENSVTPTASVGEAKPPNGADEGLGIDVDYLMNSDKFNNSSSMSDSDSTDEKSTRRKHCSFGLISRHSNLSYHVRQEKYIPRFATMDKLVDLLLLDSKYLDEDHPVNLVEFRFVFMLNYSSFLTTKDLLEKLAQRFIHSGNAVISVMKKLYVQKQGTYDPLSFGAFPRWDVDDDVDLSHLGEVDYKLLLEIQANILKVLVILLSCFFDNFLNDLYNKEVMIKLLKLYSNEILQWYNSNKIDENLNESFEKLVGLYKKLKSIFIKKSYRPARILKFDAFLTHDFNFSQSIQEVPMNRNLPSQKNIHKVEKFIIKFNKLLAIFYQGITPEDWFTIFKVLENLFVNNTLLNYDIQKPSTSENNLRISDVFTYLESLFETNSQDKLLNKFPLVFKKLFTLYQKFKTYLLIQLCDVNISEEERLERMKTLLLMVLISRLKMKDSIFVFEGDRDTIPSCVETAITGIIYSPESRALANLWLRASPNLSGNVQSQGLNFEGFESLIPKHINPSDLTASNEPLLPCFGWIIQNLIHLNECPSFHRVAINFNKRYFLYKLIKELNVEDQRSNEPQKDTKDFEFLFKLDERLLMGRFAKAENSGNSSLFSGILKKQLSINIRDEQKRGLMRRRSVQGPDQIHSTHHPSSNSLRRQSLTYKTASSSRFKISGLFNKSRSFGHANAYERAVAYKELPDPVTVADIRQKPVLVIQLKERKIFPVYLLPYCFKFDAHNTNEACFFQASSDEEAKSWLQILNYANRHWFLSRSINFKSDHSHTFFGIPLAAVCARDGLDSPSTLNLIYDVIEKNHLKEVGIYRISASLSELNSIKLEINRTGTLNLRNRDVDVHTLTSCIKLFFRELPDALLTDQVIELLCALKCQANAEHEFTDDDVRDFRRSLSDLPRVNYYTLKALTKHLSIVVQESENNKMTSSNLATVIGPALTEASSLESLMNNFGIMNRILELLIDNYQRVFNWEAIES